MQRRIFSLIAIPAIVLGFAACGSSTKSSASNPTTTAAAASGPTTTAATQSASGAQITISPAFKFTTTPVKAGSTVMIKNDSDATHTVTANDAAGGFNVTIDAGKTATFTAPKAGTYKFHCNIHNYMMGTLTVS